MNIILDANEDLMQLYHQDLDKSHRFRRNMDADKVRRRKDDRTAKVAMYLWARLGDRQRTVHNTERVKDCSIIKAR